MNFIQKVSPIEIFPLSTQDVDFNEKKKYSKKYKDVKIFFIDMFDVFIEILEDNKKLNELVKEIRIKMFDYIGIILTNDIDDLINKLIKKYLHTENALSIIDYLDFVFNRDLYKILINDVIYEKKKNNVALSQEDKLYFIGIIKVETIKILLIQNILNNENNYEEIKNLTKKNNELHEYNNEIENQYIDKDNLEIKKYIEDYIKKYYFEIFKHRIKESLDTILLYYNELKYNFTDWNDVMYKCKNIILRNNIFQQLQKIK
jgi:hypothetical protein